MNTVQYHYTYSSKGFSYGKYIVCVCYKIICTKAPNFEILHNIIHKTKHFQYKRPDHRKVLYIVRERKNTPLKVTLYIQITFSIGKFKGCKEGCNFVYSYIEWKNIKN